MFSNVEIVKELYTRFAKRDYLTISELIDQEARWEQLDGFPEGGIFHGIENEKNNFFIGDDESWNDWYIEVSEFIDAGPTVLALGKYKGDYVATDRSMQADFLHLFEIENGKIVRFKQYTDTLTVAHAMRLIRTSNEERVFKRKINQIILG